MVEALTRKYGPLPGWAWGLIVAIAAYAYLYYRKKKTAAAAAAAQQQQGLSSNLGTVPVSNLTTTAQPMPIQLGDTFVNSSTPVTVNPSTPVNITNTPPPAQPLPPAPAPPPPPAPVATPATKAYGLVNTVQGLMYWLGVNTAGSGVYNVGGGAPVYFGNASGLATGSQYEKPGQDIYTPVGYGNQIAGTPVPLQSAYQG